MLVTRNMFVINCQKQQNPNERIERCTIRQKQLGYPRNLAASLSFSQTTQSTPLP